MSRITTSTLTAEAFADINALDTGYIGTNSYMGVAYFWDYTYRHTMRDLSHAKRATIHRKLLKAGLDVASVSKKHSEIIDKGSK